MNDAVPMMELLLHGVRLLIGDARAILAAGVRSAVALDGGFRGRDGRSDLYYAPFGLWVRGAVAPDDPVPPECLAYLASQGDGAELDPTHRACLVLALSLAGRRDAAARVVAERGLGVEARGGGLYSQFLTALAGLAVGLPAAPAPSIPLDAGEAPATTPECAAAALRCAWSGEPVPEPLLRAVRACVDPAGGLRASVRAPHADLLSTATGLLALRTARWGERRSEAVRHVEFVTACWRDTGLFASSPDDPDEGGDVEYTFYALLALGALVPQLGK